ncbi:MAG: SDR family oxidoreductase [Rhizobiaceae bacterium]|jgi:NAD(P)-dependent dehydrogenase (short-subunit alcohol dehydrogenase family)|nr:SDR family oxidoreductase [Rhizobiaceae bacterium]
MTPVAVVTGGASGIGLATARLLLAAGWSIGVIDANGDALAEAEAALGGDAMFLACDITDEDETAEAFDAVIERFGLITGLVNSAGVALGKPAEETTADEFRRILDINLVGSFICARAAMERMGPRLAIVNVSSASGLRANAGRVAYGAAKAGVIMMTEVMAMEHAAQRIRINCVAPGPIETPLVSRLHGAEERQTWLERTPMNRYGAPEEVARAIAFLLSDDASYITGHTLAVDGGFTIAGIIPE